MCLSICLPSVSSLEWHNLQTFRRHPPVTMNIPSFQSREKASEDAYIRKREAEKAAAAKQTGGASQSKTETGQGPAQAGGKTN